MDGPRFDAWTRSLARGRSRRGALRVLAGGGLGAMLAQLAPRGAGAQEAQAVCGFVGEPCRVNGECCHGNRCNGRRCVCRPNHTDCGGRCRDLRFNENHCGECGNRCEAGQTCCWGRCGEGPCCPGGAVRINGRCHAVCRNGRTTCDPTGGCNGNPACTCATRVGGGSVCVGGAGSCVGCESDADCVGRDFDPGSVCVVSAGDCCGGSSCQDPCG